MAASSTGQQDPVGQRVAANLRRIRQERGFSFAELSRRLALIGHPIADTGLLKTEKGGRRVDAADLVALALALDVTPNTLMMPETDLRSAAVSHALTPEVVGSPQQLWAWAQGEVPIDSPLDEFAVNERPHDREYFFITDAKPYLTDIAVISGAGIPGRDGDRLPEVQELLGGVVVKAEQALTAGLSGAEVRCATELAIITWLASEGETGDGVL